MSRVALSFVFSILLSSQAFAQSASPLVGTWERIALLTASGSSNQPPTPPAFLVMTSDGYWMQVAIPANRPKLDKPIGQLTKEELLERFTRVEVRGGAYTVDGNRLIRRNVQSVDPNQEGTTQPQRFRVEGNLLIVCGDCLTDARSKAEARFRRVTPAPAAAVPTLVGAWERFADTGRDGSEERKPGAIVMYGADGHYFQMVIPRGRPRVSKPLSEMSREELLSRFQEVVGHRGTYTISGNRLTRHKVVHTDPSAEGTDEVDLLRIEGSMLTYSSPDPTSRSQAQYRRLLGNPPQSGPAR